jgi:hypothetical protein
MPLPVIAGVTRCAVKWHNTTGDIDAINVMHFYAAPGDEADLLASLDANAQPHQFEGMSSATSVIEVVMTPLDGSSSSATGTLENWVGSSGAGDIVPAQCIVVSAHTALRGRSNSGRTYLPFPVESITDAGTIDIANANEIAAAWNDFGAAMVTDGHDPVVASYKNEDAHVITRYSVSYVLGTQRRRQDQLRH